MTPGCPATAAGRPRDRAGRVIPFVVAIHPRGPLFGRFDDRNQDRALRRFLCSVCGHRIRGRGWLPLPADGSEPAAHLACLRYAAAVCPHLLRNPGRVFAAVTRADHYSRRPRGGSHRVAVLLPRPRRAVRTLSVLLADRVD